MPSPLVCQVRNLIRARTEEGRPLTMPERALLLATLAPPRRDAGDVVEELEAAIAHARRHALTAGIPEDTRRAVSRLLAAARAVLDHVPPEAPRPDTATTALATLPPDPRPRRVDVDG